MAHGCVCYLFVLAALPEGCGAFPYQAPGQVSKKRPAEEVRIFLFMACIGCCVDWLVLVVLPEGCGAASYQAPGQGSKKRPAEEVRNVNAFAYLYCIRHAAAVVVNICWRRCRMGAGLHRTRRLGRVARSGLPRRCTKSALLSMLCLSIRMRLVVFVMYACWRRCRTGAVLLNIRRLGRAARSTLPRRCAIAREHIFEVWYSLGCCGRLLVPAALPDQCIPRHSSKTLQHVLLDCPNMHLVLHKFLLQEGAAIAGSGLPDHCTWHCNACHMTNLHLMVYICLAGRGSHCRQRPA